MKKAAALLACLAGLTSAPVGAQTADQAAPKAAPPAPQSKTNGQGGETLAQRLDRDNGVIKPPSNTDPAMAIPAPSTPSKGMPVIPPPGSPGGDQSVQPK